MPKPVHTRLLFRREKPRFNLTAAQEGMKRERATQISYQHWSSGVSEHKSNAPTPTHAILVFPSTFGLNSMSVGPKSDTCSYMLQHTQSLRLVSIAASTLLQHLPLHSKLNNEVLQLYLLTTSLCQASCYYYPLQ